MVAVAVAAAAVVAVIGCTMCDISVAGSITLPSRVSLVITSAAGLLIS